MIIVNTTFVIHKDIVNEITEWIKNTYIASANKCGAIAERTLITKVLDSHDPESDTFAIHVAFDNLTDARKWNDGVGASLRSILAKRWGDKVLTFHTYLEVTE